MTVPFTVLMSYYDGDDAGQLAEAFDSVTAGQELPPDEVVLVRDGPVGEVLAARVERMIDASSVPVRHVVLERNGGLSAALTAGLAEASHDVVARMDADDVSTPDRFARQIPLIADGYDIVGSALVEFGDGVAEQVRPVPVGQEQIVRQARSRSPFQHPSVVYRASAVREAGGYEELPLMEDYWLWARMLHGGARAENLPEPLLRYRVDDGAYSRRGGLRLLRSELVLQGRMRRLGFVSTGQWLRNVAIRAPYRLVPESVRRLAYRAVFVRKG
ncbi:MAG: glycosyltransferase [Aeromicrobium sp.]|uniref:glycosyltransferase n=1 Tax=Aeromicrobium sp. TaxID=1871063 RepID=UPI0039E5772D